MSSKRNTYGSDLDEPTNEELGIEPVISAEGLIAGLAIGSACLVAIVLIVIAGRVSSSAEARDDAVRHDHVPHEAGGSVAVSGGTARSRDDLTVIAGNAPGAPEYRLSVASRIALPSRDLLPLSVTEDAAPHKLGTNGCILGVRVTGAQIAHGDSAKIGGIDGCAQGVQLTAGDQWQ